MMDDVSADHMWHMDLYDWEKSYLKLSKWPLFWFYKKTTENYDKGDCKIGNCKIYVL